MMTAAENLNAARQALPEELRSMALPEAIEQLVARAEQAEQAQLSIERLASEDALFINVKCRWSRALGLPDMPEATARLEQATASRLEEERQRGWHAATEAAAKLADERSASTWPDGLAFGELLRKGNTRAEEHDEAYRLGEGEERDEEKAAR